MEWITDPQGWIALLTLTALEIVLGIDNIIFISILAGKLPPQDQQRARIMGLGAAMFSRIALLLSLSWVISLTNPLFTVFRQEISGRDLVLIIGGLFLLYKSTVEIHEKLENAEESPTNVRVTPSFIGTILQILVLDIVFSLDSVITAVGMVEQVSIMVLAIVIAVGVMMFFSKWIGDFVNEHPTVKILALSFLLLVGVTLIAEGFDQHVSKGYIYFAMFFSTMVEALNIKMRKTTGPPVQLRDSPREPDQQRIGA